MSLRLALDLRKQKNLPKWKAFAVRTRLALDLWSLSLVERTLTPGGTSEASANKKPSEVEGFCGAYEARTRDPMRDRHVF